MMVDMTHKQQVCGQASEQSSRGEVKKGYQGMSKTAGGRLGELGYDAKFGLQRLCSPSRLHAGEEGNE
jgi:hypothetical protein